MIDEEQSDLELALTYIADFPELTGNISPESFPTFWEYPALCIALYKETTNILRVSCGFTDEMIKEYCLDYLADACDSVANLKAKEP